MVKKRLVLGDQNLSTTSFRSSSSAASFSFRSSCPTRDSGAGGALERRAEAGLEDVVCSLRAKMPDGGLVATCRRPVMRCMCRDAARRLLYVRRGG